GSLFCRRRSDPHMVSAASGGARRRTAARSLNPSPPEHPGDGLVCALLSARFRAIVRRRPLGPPYSAISPYRARCLQINSRGVSGRGVARRVWAAPPRAPPAAWGKPSAARRSGGVAALGNFRRLGGAVPAQSVG